MADAAKGRKRTKKTFFDDSDDDFSTSTPPFQDQAAKPKSKLKKKKRSQQNDETSVYTSTQGVDGDNGRGRKERLSPEERRFQKELEEALKISADDTVSSSEIVSVLGGKDDPSLTTVDLEHNPSSATTVDVDDLMSSSAEQEGAPVPSGSNVGFGELTEKEVVVGEEDQDEFAPDDNPQSIKQPANPQSINQPANPQSINQPANPPTILEAKLGKKKLKKFKDGWIVNTEKIQVEAQVHAAPPSGTEATDNQLNSDSDEEFVPKQKKKTPPKSVTQKRPLRKSKSPVINTEDIDKIEEAEEELMKKDVSSPLKKRKRAARRVLDSDSDSDFGAEDKIPRLKEKDENTYEEEDEESEEEFVPKSKKKTPVRTEKKERPVRKSKSPLKTKQVPSTPLANHCDNIPVESAKSNIEPGKRAVSEKLTKITSPKQPAVPATAVVTPVQSKSLDRSHLTKVKIPAWTPPARVGRSLQTGSPASSPVIGLRLGLSRNMRVSKPLHSAVKNTE